MPKLRKFAQNVHINSPGLLFAELFCKDALWGSVECLSVQSGGGKNEKPLPLSWGWGFSPRSWIASSHPLTLIWGSMVKKTRGLKSYAAFNGYRIVRTPGLLPFPLKFYYCSYLHRNNEMTQPVLFLVADAAPRERGFHAWNIRLFPGRSSRVQSTVQEMAGQHGLQVGTTYCDTDNRSSPKLGTWRK